MGSGRSEELSLGEWVGVGKTGEQLAGRNGDGKQRGS